MSNEWWSYILTAVGITGFFLAGRKIWWSWYINIACQVLWFAYAIVTTQYGFIAAALLYTVVFGKNAWQWTREHFKKPEQVISTEPQSLKEYGVTTKRQCHVPGPHSTHYWMDSQGVNHCGGVRYPEVWCGHLTLHEGHDWDGEEHKYHCTGRSWFDAE